MKKFLPIIIIRRDHVERIEESTAKVALQLAKAQRLNTIMGVVTLILIISVIYYLVTNDNGI